MTSSSSSEKSGMSPGSLVHIGEQFHQESRITLINYNSEKFEKHTLHSADDILKYQQKDTVTWVIVEGLTNTNLIDDIGKLFEIHELVLEDLLNTHQRPKFEEYDDYLYMVLKGLQTQGDDFKIKAEQIGILLFKNLVFTFKEKKDELLEPVYKRIQASKGRFRSFGADYLMYAILDTVVDQYFLLIDDLDEDVTTLEDDLLTSDPSQEQLNTIQKLKREIITAKRFISPTRELMAGVLRCETELVTEKTHIYLRDVSDHAIRVIELIESYRDILSGLLDIYLSSLSNKMNEVMKVLTVFASIFIPLTFIAGVYGMNFEFMPELKWKWSYPILWAVFIFIAVVLIRYFKKNKWL